LHEIFSNCIKTQKRNDDGDFFPTELLSLTHHRAENLDDLSILQALATQLSKIKNRIVFPVHPRTRNTLKKYNIPLSGNVMMIEPGG
jgi:UDP-N-acetylglucosamine 2-epimerase